jgi:hypothetical protein
VGEGAVAEGPAGEEGGDESQYASATVNPGDGGEAEEEEVEEAVEAEEEPPQPEEAEEEGGEAKRGMADGLMAMDMRVLIILRHCVSDRDSTSGDSMHSN